jgi:hypothetical protein
LVVERDLLSFPLESSLKQSKSDRFPKHRAVTGGRHEAFATLRRTVSSYNVRPRENGRQRITNFKSNQLPPVRALIFDTLE